MPIEETGLKRSADISDTIRIYPIITKSGAAVSVVPAEVHGSLCPRGLAQGDP